MCIRDSRYTRVRDLFAEFSACFKDADHVIVAPLYTAGESPIPGIDSASLAEGIRKTGHRSVESIGQPFDLVPSIKRVARSGDIVVCLGAGQSTEWAHALPQWLAEDQTRTGSAA